MRLYASQHLLTMSGGPTVRRQRQQAGRPACQVRQSVLQVDPRFQAVTLRSGRQSERARPRSDGGVKRSDRDAAAFATLKSVIRTRQNNGLNYLGYGLQVVRSRAVARPAGAPARVELGTLPARPLIAISRNRRVAAR